jgi:electron transport complex protein RnfC
MQSLTFKRGVHPDDAKALTMDKSVKVILPKEGSELFFPMSQHIGAPCEPIVQKGDYVKVGQKIGEAKGFVSSPIFASVSGEVTDIRPVLIPSGGKSLAVVIKIDGLMAEYEGLQGCSDWTKLTKEEILAKIKEGGVVGMGGAGFPTQVKLAPKEEIDYVIVNGAECEPYLTCDYRLMLEQPQKLVEGLKIVLSLFPKAKGVIGIEDNKPEAIKILSDMVKDIPNIEVAQLLKKFPQGSEKHIIYAVTGGREVPSGALPSAVGCIVDNVDTIIGIYNAIVEGKPVMRKIMTVSGSAPMNPGNYQIRVGMTYKDIMEQIGGFKTEPAKIIAGGPMMGFTMFTLDTATTKTSSALLCFTTDEAYIPPEGNCIRCAKCADHCPMGLQPFRLNQLALRGDSEGFLANNGLDCINCGSCSFECPAKRHLAQSITARKRIEGALKAAAAAKAKEAAAKKEEAAK